MFSIHQLVNKPVPSNCYVLFDKEMGDDCIVIDPGSRDEHELFVLLLKEDLIPKYIVLTHEHFDHCWGVNQLVSRYKIPIICSELCSQAIKYAKRNCSVFYDNNSAFTIKSETISIESLGKVLKFGDYLIRFENTPGHTDAGICLIVDKFLFTGDTLIKNIRTVTKLPTGSVSKLLSSLDLFESMAGENMIVYPGHNESFPLYGYDLSAAIK